MVPSPTQSNVLAALRSFLVQVLPPVGSDGKPVSVLAAQQNRTPEPQGSDFCIMTPTAFERLETNLDGYADAKFTGSISGQTMTITGVDPDFSGQLGVGSTIFGVNVAANTVITALGTGSGSIGTYTVNNAQMIPSQILAAGTESIQQGAKITVQLDFHSADLSAAADMAQTVSTLFRDDFAVQQFANQIPHYDVTPLLADDPKQVPFLNAEEQYEWRWVVEAMLQVNQVVTVPLQFAEQAKVGLINVDEAYPQ